MAMENKKVDIIVKFFYPVAAGIETNIMETYSVLVKKGWKVVVHTSTGTLTTADGLPEHETIRGIEVKRYKWQPWGFVPKLTPGVDLVALHNFNIVPHSWIMLWSILLKLTGQRTWKLIVTPHGGYNPEWSTFPAFTGRLKRLYHETLGTWLVNAGIDGVRAVSAWEEKEMIACGIRPTLIQLISNGIEDQAFKDNDKEISSEFAKKIKSYGKYIIQIGRIHAIKNFETVIKALPKIPSDITFIIAGPVGTEDYKLQLEKLIDSLHLNDRVKFVGVVRGAEKFALIKHAQLMVHMAIWESYCNVVHEGMSQGLVCIVSNITALPLLVKDGVNGFCLPPKDYAAVAKKITFILDKKNEKLKNTIERRNSDEVRSHSWSKVALRMNDWYTQLSRSTK